MGSKRIIINTHIEKTAGTSLLKFFEDTVGKQKIAFYDPTTDSLVRVSDLLLSPSNDFVDRLQLKSYAFWPSLKKTYFKTRSKYAQKIPSDIAIIHGHFTSERFDKVVKNPIMTVVIRDPLKRMYSQYDHWKHAKGRNHWRIIIPYDPQLSFEAFALLPAMQNYQIKALAGKKLASFDLVGTTEKLNMFSSALFQMFIREGYVTNATPVKSIPKLNKHRKKYVANKKFEALFKKFHKEDYLLYEQAKRLAK